MSCRRSAIINLSSWFSSIEKCPENFPAAPMFPYRISKAPLTPRESIQSMLSVMSSLSDKDSGTLLDWQGNKIPW
ncbi:uncharacterized protein ACN63O_021146 [Diretmus argenteus]